MKKIITLLLIVFSFISCSNDDDKNQNPVVGTWKMVKIETPNMLTNSINSEDVSTQNITYTFDKRSNLTINTNGKKEYFKYEYKMGSLGDEMPGEIKSQLVIIDGSKWTYKMIEGKMVLGKSYVDASDLFFVKE